MHIDVVSNLTLSSSNSSLSIHRPPPYNQQKPKAHKSPSKRSIPDEQNKPSPSHVMSKHRPGHLYPLCHLRKSTPDAEKHILPHSPTAGTTGNETKHSTAEWNGMEREKNAHVRWRGSANRQAIFVCNSLSPASSQNLTTDVPAPSRSQDDGLKLKWTSDMVPLTASSIRPFLRARAGVSSVCPWSRHSSRHSWHGYGTYPSLISDTSHRKGTGPREVVAKQIYYASIQ